MFLFVFTSNNSGAFHTRGMLINELHRLNQLLKSIGTEYEKNPCYFNSKNYWRVNQPLKKNVIRIDTFPKCILILAKPYLLTKKGFVGNLPVRASSY